MVVTSAILTAIKMASLGEFDTGTHIGFGTGTTTPVISDTDLETSIIRKIFDEVAIKNIGSGTYDFSSTLGLTEGNGSTIAEVGLFDAVSAGNMFNRILLSTAVAKDVSKELSIGLRTTITVTNV
ncbi:MAG: hypothetical protein K0A90_00105 [Methanosarcinaceae archaeon]|nr:hypothetical protein [Methanosarcinaceae archaeon]